jgi:hypothetical protein
MSGEVLMNVKSALCAVAVLAATLCVAVPSASARTGFECRNVSGGSSGFTAHITDVRVGQHATFDRFVVQFRGSRVPQYVATRQSNSNFTLDGSGRPVTLRGHAGIAIRFPHATGTGSYHGRLEFRPPFVQLREARQLGDFEAVTNWGLSIHRQSCMRVFTLTSPVRLIVDVPH